MALELEIGLRGDFPGALARAASTLLVSCYHAGKLLLIDVGETGRLRLTPVAYRKPMGIAAGSGLLAIGTLDELHLYADRPDLADHVAPGRRFAHVFFPRLTFHCGPLDLHDLCFSGSELWAVNTLFSCICTFDQRASFVPRWMPPFVSLLAPEDRCHLNGLALENGAPRYATALARSDEPGGWRSVILNGGVLLHVPGGETLVGGLAMPHSPRLHRGELYLLQSAQGALCRIDTKRGTSEEVMRFEGLVRGLCMAGEVAFVGVSRAREQSDTFARLPEQSKVECAAIHALELRTGRLLGTLEFRSLVEEIYDVQAIAGREPMAVLGLYDPRHRQGVWAPHQSWWKRTPGRRSSTVPPKPG